MRSELKQLRAFRQELESFQPQTGLKKWGQIIQSMRVAGVPRSVSAAEHVVVLADFAADKSLGQELRAAARRSKKWFLNCAAYKETAWLDQKQLKRYLEAYRANGYTGPAGYTWVENREKNPYPYGDKG